MSRRSVPTRSAQFVVSAPIPKQHEVSFTNPSSFAGSAPTGGGNIGQFPATRATKASQAYFWTKEWQEGEREADEDLKRGRYKDFDSAEDAIAWLFGGAS